MLYRFVSHSFFIRNNTLKLDWHGQRTKNPQWLAFLNKDSFLLARVVLSRELLNMLYIFFPLKFSQYFLKTKRKTYFQLSCRQLCSDKEETFESWLCAFCVLPSTVVHQETTVQFHVLCEVFGKSRIQTLVCSLNPGWK